MRAVVTRSGTRRLLSARIRKGINASAHDFNFLVQPLQTLELRQYPSFKLHSIAVSLRFCCNDRDANDLWQLLVNKLGLAEDEALRIHRRPELASCPPENALAVLALLKELKLRPQKLRTAVLRSPELLATDTERLSAALQALEPILSPEVLTAVLADCPEVLLSSPSTISEVHALLDSTGVCFEKVARRAPRVMLGEPKKLRNLISFLQDAEAGPGLTREQTSSVANSFPMLLVGTRSPEKQLAPLVRFLKEELGVDPSSDACIGFYAWPDALSLIEQSAKHLMTHCGYSVEELRQDVSLLGYSFEARIYPRSMYARKLGAPRLMLRALTAVDDAQFCQIVGANLEDYREFMFELRRAARRKTRS